MDAAFQRLETKCSCRRLFRFTNSHENAGVGLLLSDFSDKICDMDLQVASDVLRVGYRPGVRVAQRGGFDRSDFQMPNTVAICVLVHS